MTVIQLTSLTSNHSDVKEVSPNDCNNDRQPEITIWPPKPLLLLFPVVDRTVGRCRNHLGTLSLNSSWSETPVAVGNERICCSSTT